MAQAKRKVRPWLGILWNHGPCRGSGSWESLLPLKHRGHVTWRVQLDTQWSFAASVVVVVEWIDNLRIVHYLTPLSHPFHPPYFNSLVYIIATLNLSLEWVIYKEKEISSVFKNLFPSEMCFYLTPCFPNGITLPTFPSYKGQRNGYIISFQYKLSCEWALGCASDSSFLPLMKIDLKCRLSLIDERYFSESPFLVASSLKVLWHFLISWSWKIIGSMWHPEQAVV